MKYSKTRIDLSILMFFFVFTITLSPSYAQNDDDIFMLEEITVTAEKREVNVQKTAVAVTAITGADIRDNSTASIGKLLSEIPGLQVQGYQAGSQVFIRGIGSNIDSDLGDPSTALLVDGVYSSRSESIMGSLYDVSRVEVLRGPQGTMYGRNAIGGSINLVSNPPTHEFGGNVNLKIGDYNLMHLDGTVNVPVSERLAGRFSVLRETRDGYLSTGGMSADKFSYRAKLLFDASDNFSFLATYERNESYGNEHGTVPVPGSAGNLPSSGWIDEFDYTEGWYVGPGADAWTNDEYHPAGVYDIVFDTYTSQFDWNFNWSKLTIIPSYSETHREVWSPMTQGTANAYEEYGTSLMDVEQWTGEARLASQDEAPFVWMLGYYWLQQENESSTTDDDGEETDLLDYDDDEWHYETSSEPIESHALFGQVTYPVLNTFRLTGGLRYSYEDRSMDYRYVNNDLDESDPLYDGDSVYDSGTLHYKNEIEQITYKAGMEYDLADASMLYLQVSSGFKAGGLNVSNSPTKYDPEELISYQIGSKNRLLNNHLQANTELYYYDYADMQIRVFEMTTLATGEMGFSQEIKNAGNGTSYGGELELEYMLTQNDRLKATVAYMHTEYGDFVLDADESQGLGELSLGGTTMANSPEWSGSLSYTHTWILDTGAEVSATLDTKLSKGYYASVQKNLPGAWQDSYSRSNARMNYFAPSGNWSASVWVKNIENEAQTSWVMPYYRRVVSEPRTFGITLSLKY